MNLPPLSADPPESLERRLREQQAMLDNDLVGIARFRDRRVVWANRAARRIFAIPLDEDVAGLETRTVHPSADSHARLASASDEAIARHGQFRSQVELLRRDGEPVWVDASATMLDPVERETLWILVDITPLRNAEENRVRALELAAENRSMRETARLQSQFLATVTHELRTPLNAILGFGQLLESSFDASATERQRDFVSKLLASGRRLLSMIQSILDVANLAANRFEFEPRPSRVETLVGEVVQLHADRASSAGVSLSARVDPGAGDMNVDSLRLRQVLSHFVANALAFTPPGGRVEVRARPEGESRVRFEVEDTGCGIAEEHLPNLFRNFRQIDGTTTRKHPGLGLGLLLTRLLIEAQHGQVGVRSRIGEGSTFFAELPRVAP